MVKKNVENTPSDTALFTALRRTLAYYEYHNDQFGSDYLAEIFLPAFYRFFLRFKWARENGKNKLAKFMPGMNEYIIARTAFFDGLFSDTLKKGIPQIVILGAGYDSRAYRFAKLNRDTKIFELDAVPTQTRKLECLKAAHISIPAEVRYVPINFMKEPLSGVLEKAGYQNGERTLFIWEGVSYYLDLDSARETLSFVSHCSQRESIIAFDYIVPISDDNPEEYFGASVFMKSMKEYHVSEGLLFSIKDEDIESFLTDCHLKMVDHMDNEAIEQSYLMTENGALIGRMIGIFRFACASPVN